MREAFSNSLVELAKADERIILLTGDHGYALFDAFRQQCPKQYVNAGIAEQNMVGMAAGLARRGFRPVVYGLSAFVPVRVVEQIKLDIAHDNLPVILIGDGAGFVYSHLGTSHQSLEDIAVLRSLPNVTIFSPADGYELSACMQSAYKASTCHYIRMGKADRGSIHDQSIDNFDSLIYVENGSKTNNSLVFLATGSMVVSARTLLRDHFPEATLYSAPQIHPLDSEQIAKVCRHAQLVVTFEEHCSLGGLGSAVCEVLSERLPKKVLRIGSEHQFSQHCGSYEYLLKEHKLDIQSIHRKISSQWTRA